MKVSDFVTEFPVQNVSVIVILSHVFWNSITALLPKY